LQQIVSGTLQQANKTGPLEIAFLNTLLSEKQNRGLLDGRKAQA
jgi:hypothetical protein